jgi:hypothetical protein
MSEFVGRRLGVSPYVLSIKSPQEAAVSAKAKRKDQIWRYVIDTVESAGAAIYVMDL